MNVMKREGLFTILIVGLMALLAGCDGQERFTYVMFDANGCAFFVERLVQDNDAGSHPDHGLPVLSGVTKDWWNGSEPYSGTIQRLSHDDLSTCKLPKE